MSFDGFFEQGDPATQSGQFLEEGSVPHCFRRLCPDLIDTNGRIDTAMDSVTLDLFVLCFRSLS